MTMQRRGLLIILSSPSGAGKSTLAKRLRAWDPSIRFSVSVTTRAPRPGEVDGREYFFVSKDRFSEMVQAGELLEYAMVFGNLYGSPRAPVMQAVDSEGADILFDIDWQGAQQLRNSLHQEHVLSVFLLPPSIEALRERLVSRGQDTADTIANRMKRSWDEISHWDAYDYVLVNDDVDETEERLRTIVLAERMRRSQQPHLVEHVRSLKAEFEEEE